MVSVERLTELLAAYKRAKDDSTDKWEAWCALAGFLVDAAPELLAVVEAARGADALAPTTRSFLHDDEFRTVACVLHEALRALDATGGGDE